MAAQRAPSRRRRQYPKVQCICVLCKGTRVRAANVAFLHEEKWGRDKAAAGAQLARQVHRLVQALPPPPPGAADQAPGQLAHGRAQVVRDFFTRVFGDLSAYGLPPTVQQPDPPLHEIPAAACARASGHMALRSRERYGWKGDDLGVIIPHPYVPTAVSFSKAGSYDAKVLYGRLLKGCRPREWGMWVDGPIPINKPFSYWGRRWIVQEASDPAMGLGLFSLQKIVVKEGSDRGVDLFVFGGPEYSQGEWPKVSGRTRHPGIRKYAITFNQCVRREMMERGEESPGLSFLDGHVLFGNVAGYINSSRGTHPSVANCQWEERSVGHDRLHHSHDHWICTVATKTIEKGDQLFIDYDWFKDSDWQLSDYEHTALQEEMQAEWDEFR